MAFDLKGGRVGRGKGYYDYFIKELHLQTQQRGGKFPLLGTAIARLLWSIPLITFIYYTAVGLSFLEQLIAEGCPMDSHDELVQYVITVDTNEQQLHFPLHKDCSTII